MSKAEPFEPQAFQVITDPRQLKAFADPRRIQLLHILAEHEATNQQLASALGEPQAKVLHHVRFLLDVELIRLVRQQIRGGNVEKYYRASARMYGLRPAADAAGRVASPVLASVLEEVIASETRWPQPLPDWEVRRLRLAPERVREFTQKLNALIAEYWGGPAAPGQPDAEGDLMGFAAITFHHPADTE